MRRHTKRSAPDLLETAGEWALRAEAGLSPRDEARLAAWLEVAPNHRAAYDAVLHADQALGRHGADEAMMVLRGAALKARPESRWPSLRAVAASLVAALLVAGAMGWGAGPLSHLTAVFGVGGMQTARYVTAAGERASVTLEDGSVLALNADSAAEVTFSGRSRMVRLEKGQAFFTVAHDASRPFEVLADDRRVTAVGTAFDVLLLPGALRVAMLDGVVRVSSDGQRPTQILSKGEVMTARANGTTTVRKADAARLAGWRDGVVYFEETPLSEAVAEMNRYTRRPIVVAEGPAGALRVSGAFRVAEADAFAETMTDIFPLSTKHSADGRTILMPATM